MTTSTVAATGHNDVHPHMSVRDYLVIYAALLGLMALTLVAALFDLGAANFGVAMGIASVKTVLIILYFMHVKFGEKLTWVFSVAAIFWLLIMVAGFLNDYFTRDTFVAGK